MTERFAGALNSANAEFLFLNIIATYRRNLYASVCGIFISWCVLAAVGKSEFGLYGVVGGMTVIALLACAIRLDRGRIAVVMPADEWE